MDVKEGDKGEVKRITFAGVSFASKVTNVEASEGEKQTTLKGYPIVWNQLSSDRGGYRVRLAPGSATFTTPCLALYNHDFNKPLGNTANGTLRILPADDYGVAVEIDLPDTTSGNDVGEEVEDGYTRGMSFSMLNGFEEYTDSKEVVDGVETKIRTVTKFTVDEVTVTIVPAFTGTTIEVKQEVETEDKQSMSASMLGQHRLRWTVNKLYTYRE